MLASVILFAVKILVPMAFLSTSAALGTGEHLDPKCPSTMLPGFQINTFQFNVPAEGFYEKIGSFFHAEWYDGPLNSTHGKDNTVGSTRSGTIAGTFYTNRLVAYEHSSNQLMFQYVLDNAPVTFGGTTFTSWAEEMQIMSICGGSATYITMTVVYCTNKPAKAYDGYDSIRRSSIGTVANQLNALMFLGTCLISSDQ